MSCTNRQEIHAPNAWLAPKLIEYAFWIESISAIYT